MIQQNQAYRDVWSSCLSTDHKRILGLNFCFKCSMWKEMAEIKPLSHGTSWRWPCQRFGHYHGSWGQRVNSICAIWVSTCYGISATLRPQGPGFYRLWGKLPACIMFGCPLLIEYAQLPFVHADLVIVYLITYLHAQLLSLGTSRHICICKSWLGLLQNDCTCKLQQGPFINP